MEAYGQSKLANLFFTYELDRRLDEEEVAVNALHPGLVNTHLGKDHWVVGPLLNMIHFFFAKNPEQGAHTPICLAGSPDVEGVSGEYYTDRKPVRSSAVSYDKETARRLWKISEEMTAL
jgi:retinol dehydrogenase-14